MHRPAVDKRGRSGWTRVWRGTTEKAERQGRRSRHCPKPNGRGYEAELWRMADALRAWWTLRSTNTSSWAGFLSDAFEERHARLEGEQAQGADPEGVAGQGRRVTTPTCPASARGSGGGRTQAGPRALRPAATSARKRRIEPFADKCSG